MRGIQQSQAALATTVFQKQDDQPVDLDQAQQEQAKLEQVAVASSMQPHKAGKPTVP